MSVVVALILAFASMKPDAALDRLLANENRAVSPGCALDVRRQGLVIAQCAVGLANLENGTPITQDTVFEAGSVSKQFIGAGIALLHMQGRLSLEDSVRRWLPELPDHYAPITLRMMLNHSSGIKSWNNLAELTGRGEDESGYDNNRIVSVIARQSGLNSTPGTEYLYSNSNYVLGAKVIERVSGQELNAFFRTVLFHRFGMTRTAWRTDFRAVIADRAQAYSPAEGRNWRLDVPLNGVVGAGGLMTTVGDLQRWNAVLENPEQADRAWTELLTEQGKLLDGTRLRYGLGLELDALSGKTAITHAGSTGAYRAWLGRVPDDGLSVALLCNDGSLNTEDLGPAITSLYMTTVPNAPNMENAAPLLPVAGLAGRYRNLLYDAAVDVTVEHGQARFNAGVVFIAIGPEQLVTLDRARSARLKRNAQGSVQSISLSRQGNTPVPLTREVDWAPDERELAKFTGRFRSADLEGEHRFGLVDGQLRWINPAGEVQPITPIYRDTFAAPQTSWTLRFTRGPDGRVSGLDASITRARRIHYSIVRSDRRIE